VEVMDTGSIVINGLTHKKILLQTVGKSPVGIDAWVVENIGPIGGQYLFPTGRNVYDSLIICFEIHSFKCYQDSVLGLFNPSGIECEYLLNHAGIADNSQQSDFHLYPNPSSDVLNIKFKEAEDYQMTIIDINGRIIKSQNLSKQHEKINISEFTDGLYYLRINTKTGNSISRKFIKL
jgi:hemin uptake protein HemP